MKRYIKMAESPMEGHPDKLADIIADALLDEFIRKDPYSRVSLEILLVSGMTFVSGHVSTESYVDIPGVVRNTIKEVGYNKPEYGFDADTSAVITSIEEQSPEIALGISSEGAGDTATVIGYACRETENYMPLPISLAHLLSKSISEMRKSGRAPFLRPDGKVLLTVLYEDEKPLFVKDLVVFVQHDPDVSLDKLREFVQEEVLKKTLPQKLISEATRIMINPSGRFVMGGPIADVGQTGRKIVSDAYGDVAYSGGSAFSGKDPTKTDRSASYLARMMAKHVVACGFADRCMVQMAYAFGVSEVIAFDIETYGTERVDKEKIKSALLEVFPTGPKKIIDFLDLRKPIYKKTACYGHFGKEEFPWEKLTKVEELKERLS
ncbi:MAG: methionine adenosyltransferase [Hydrogenobacter thermophilus]|uniref:methionine adenosyltransferase n=1 Tax=Hydrogenobacter thermophilus TaxID=940 RepID=UPI001C765E30|nr:methionine adenosyltransferase [Hydrogenobacter thermophilus]QWK19097.1 MAG: methionine adenosyltransferase [Hydrogenobacter thermophilus]